MDLTRDLKEMGTFEINLKLGFHKATISRDIQNLVTNGFLTQNTLTKKCMLGSSQRLMSNKDSPPATELKTADAEISTQTSYDKKITK